MAQRQGNKRLIALLLAVTGLLLIPMIAMQFTDEVNWTGTDFALAGALLFGTAILVEYVLRSTARSPLRILLVILLLVALLLVWVELAVGIFGSPIAGD